jgi:alanyl aminopeptidase
MGARSRWVLLGALLAFASGCKTAGPPVTGPPQASAARTSPAQDRPIFRLPGDVRPERQAVELEVVPDRDGFTGRVEIPLRFLATRADLWVSSRGLQLSEGRLELGGETLPVQLEPDDSVGAVRVVLPRPVGPGAATLRLAFAGSFNQRLSGLYRVKSGDRWYAFTQFEAIDARLAFPCFDEPAFKIPWDLTVTVRSGDVAVSNTTILDEAPAASGLKRVKFGTTRPLPSYLVALAVGEFDVVQAPELPPNEIRHRSLQLRGVATKGRGSELGHALRASAEMLVLLERWFGLEFPYEKLDLIAVPDFKFGAMENAGAITFSEYTLLVDPVNASEMQKQWVAVDVAHEMAHQWFGDLVTMAWWDDLWLNESFATFMEHEIVSAWAPALRYDLVALTAVQRGMATDALASAKPIRPRIVFEADIFGVDYGLVYAKGAAVIGMFEQFLGNAAFRRAIQGYLRSHADGNATLEDLLSALSAKVPAVGPAMRSFIEQPGVPLVDGKLVCRSGKVLLELRQSRFHTLGSELPEGMWKVPVCARMEGVPDPVCTLLKASRGTLQLPGKRCPQWVELNAGAAGYYRWTLPTSQLQPLLARANALLGPAERLSVANNLVAAFHAGRLDTGDAITSLEPFAVDDEPEVALEPTSLLGALRWHVVSPALQPNVQAYARQLYGPVLGKLGWEAKPDEPARVRDFRGSLVGFLALRAADEEVLSRAAQLGQRYLGDDGKLHPEAVDVNLVGPALMAAAVRGDAKLFDLMLDRFEHSSAAVVRANLLFGFAAFRDPELASRARSLTFDSRLRTDERTWIIVSQLRAAETHADAWKWIQAHGAEVFRAIPPDHVDYVVAAAAGCSAGEAAGLEALRSTVAELPGGAYGIEKAAEATRRCAALVAAQRPEADAFFQKSARSVAGQ